MRIPTAEPALDRVDNTALRIMVALMPRGDDYPTYARQAYAAAEALVVAREGRCKTADAPSLANYAKAFIGTGAGGQ